MRVFDVRRFLSVTVKSAVLQSAALQQQYRTQNCNKDRWLSDISCCGMIDDGRSASGH